MSNQSVSVSIEPLDEYHVQEISYDGVEKLIQPLSISENLAKLAQKIDFSKPIEDVEKMETELSTEDEKTTDEDNKELASFQASLWPWDSVRNKLRNALTEMSVLLDVITIAKDKRYLVLDPVSQEKPDYKPINCLVSKKKALQSAALVLLSSAERLRSAQSDMQRNKSSDFHVDLMNMRKKWRLKKVGNNILGDLSYRNAGSRYPHSGTFEVTKTENIDLSISDKSSILKVVVPSDLEGLCYIHVSIQKDQETLSNVEFSVPSFQSPNVEPNWQQKLENAQNVLFCKELFSNLAREAVQLQLPIPTLVIGNQIIVTLFPGIQLTIALCHSTVKSKRTVCENKKPQLTPKNHNHVLEHSLHQLLQEVHYKALHQPMPHPVTATLGINRKRYFAGPEAIDKQTLIESCKNETMLEQIVAQSQHIVLRTRTMRLIDELATDLSDPLLVAHWLTLSSPVQSSVRLNISSFGYENLCRSPVVIHIGTRSLKAICRDGRKFNLSYETNELKCLLLSQISQHQAFAAQALAKMMGWKVLSFTTNCGIGPVEKIGTASSLVLCSPNGKKQISIRHGTETGAQVIVSETQNEENFKSTSLIKDSKWHALNSNSLVVDINKMEGKSFLSKIEFLMANQTIEK